MQECCQAACSRSPLFAGRMVECHTKRFADGESLSDYADEFSCVGLMSVGLADVWCPAPDGTMTLLNTIRLGDCFGIAYLYGTSGMQTQVRARGDCEAVFIRKTLLQRLLITDAFFAERYFTLCNRKLQFLLGRITLLTAQSCRHRLIAYLLLNRNDDGMVALRGTKEELASRLSVSRAAIYREFSAMQKSGLIEMDKRGIRLPDPSRLEALLYNDSQGM